MAPLASWLAARGKARSSSAREPTLPRARANMQQPVRSNLAVGRLPFPFCNCRGRAASACSMPKRLCHTHHATSSARRRSADEEHQKSMHGGVRAKAAVGGRQTVDRYSPRRTDSGHVRTCRPVSGLLRVRLSCSPVSLPPCLSLMSVLPSAAWSVTGRVMVSGVPWPCRCNEPRQHAPCATGHDQLTNALQPRSGQGSGRPPSAQWTLHPAVCDGQLPGQAWRCSRLGSCPPTPFVGFASQSRYVCPDLELLALPQS